VNTLGATWLAAKKHCGNAAHRNTESWLKAAASLALLPLCFLSQVGTKGRGRRAGPWCLYDVGKDLKRRRDVGAWAGAWRRGRGDALRDASARGEKTRRAANR